MLSLVSGIFSMILEMANSCDFNGRLLNWSTVIDWSISFAEIIIFNFLLWSKELPKLSTESAYLKNSFESIVSVMNSLLVLNSSTISWKVGRASGFEDQHRSISFL